MRKNQSPQYGPRYTVFLGIMERAKDEWVNGHSFADSLTLEELRLLNGYQINTGDYDMSIYQTYGLNSVSFHNRDVTFRLGAYCMERDKERGV